MATRIVIGVLVIPALALLGCGDRGPVCGNGVREGDEQCDGADVGDATCGGLVANATGELGCGDDCRYDLTTCAWCGNSRRDFGESCDCGTDPEHLPVSCTDVNGGANANCPADCNRGGECNDGVLDAGEECDCGMDSENLPPDCEDVNGGADGNCDSDCLIWPEPQ